MNVRLTIWMVKFILLSCVLLHDTQYRILPFLDTATATLLVAEDGLSRPVEAARPKLELPAVFGLEEGPDDWRGLLPADMSVIALLSNSPCSLQ